MAALVLIIAVGVTLFLTLGGDDSDTTASTTTAATTTTTSSSSESSSSESTSSSPSSTSASSSGDDLLSIVPLDFSDCSAASVPSDGAVDAAECGAAGTQPGPEAAAFFLYEDQGTLDSVFTADIAQFGVQPIADGQDCTTAVGSGTWTAGGVPGGQVACGISPDGFVFIAWTDDEFLTEGVVQLTGTTQAEVATLYDWWLTNSNYQG